VRTIKKFITCDDIADYFIAFANVTNTSITNLKLQKMVYYAQAWYLALYNRPLFQGNFQAWTHGPVSPKLYYKYRSFGWKPIEQSNLDEDFLDISEENFGEELSDFLEEIISKYFGLTALQLESLTHSEAPWKIARCGLAPKTASNNLIKNEDMLIFYKSQAENFNP